MHPVRFTRTTRRVVRHRPTRDDHRRPRRPGGRRANGRRRRRPGDAVGTPHTQPPSSAASLAVLLVAVSLVPFGWLHVAETGAPNPVSWPVSYYVLAPHGPALLAAGAVTLAVGTAMLLVGLVTTGAAVDRASRVLVGAWIVALLLVIGFPMDDPGPGSTFSGLVHDGAGAVLFTSLPAAGWRLAAAFGAAPAWADLTRAVRLLSGGTVAALAAFLAVHPPVGGMRHPLVRLPGGVQAYGLVERVLLGLEITLLLVVGTRLRRLARAARPLPGAETATGAVAR